MTERYFEVKGLDEGVQSSVDLERTRLLDPSGASGGEYRPENEYLRELKTFPEDGKIVFKHRNKGVYTVQDWSDERDQGVVTDPSQLTWFYDAEKDATAYVHDNGLTAAFNSDISDSWEALMSGRWMMDFQEEFRSEIDQSDGLNRLSPEKRREIVQDVHDVF